MATISSSVALKGPLDDMMREMWEFKRTTGEFPTKILFSTDGFNAFCSDPQVVERTQRPWEPPYVRDMRDIVSALVSPPGVHMKVAVSRRFSKPWKMVAA